MSLSKSRDYSRQKGSKRKIEKIAQAFRQSVCGQTVAVNCYESIRIVSSFLGSVFDRLTLNLAEGSAKGTHKDRARFYRIALGSQRECAAVLDLATPTEPTVTLLCDRLGAHLYKLVHSN